MKLDRLLSRIRAALQGYASEFEQRALAAEYADLCTLAAQRLEQIVPLIRENQDYPALQIAESPPHVLDLVRQLSFVEAEQWRAYCRKNGLPVGQPFDEQHVNLVNLLYAKKIGETHPLYRDYRQAIRTRNDDQALRVLQSIRRINTDDANAHGEYLRLTSKVLTRRMADLSAALDRGDTAHVLALTESIETDALQGREQNPIWPRALAVRDAHQLKTAQERCLAIAGELRRLHEAEHWRETIPLFAEWDLLRGQFDFSLPGEIETETAATREWAGKFLAVRDREEERQRMWRDLSTRLGQLAHASPNRSSRIMASELQELLTHANVLQAQASGADGGSAPPRELVQRLERETGILRRKLAQRRLRKIGMAAVSAAAVIVVVLLLAWQHARAVRLREQTASIIKYLDAGSSHELADALKAFDADHPNYVPSEELAGLLKQARQYVTTHEEARLRFENEFAQISQAAASKPSPDDIIKLLKNLDELNNLAKTLAPDDFARIRPQAQELRTHLNQALAASQEQRAARLAGIVGRVQKLLEDQLTSTTSAETAGTITQAAQKILAEADQVPPNPAVATAAEIGMRAQLDALVKKVTNLADASRDAVAARAELADARTLDAYRAAVDSLSTNILTSDPDVSAAHALDAKLPDWTAAAQSILLPGDAATWDFLQNVSDSRLQPATNAQNEDIAFSRLVHSDILANTYRAELVTYADGAPVQRMPVFLAGALDEKNNKIEKLEEVWQTGNIINPNGTTTEHKAHWLLFAGQKARGEKFEAVQIAPESTLVNRLNQTFDPRTGAIREPLLRVLDDVRADPDASPILKAYLVQEIFKIIQDRPRDWGLTYSTSAQADNDELTKITGGSLAPSDWLFPGNPRLAPELQAFFQRTAGHNYYEEASQNLEKLLTLRRIPVIFAGHVDLQLQPQLLEPQPAKAELWGLDSAGRWELVFDCRDGNATRAANAPAPAALSPLVYLGSAPRAPALESAPPAPAAR